jgi:hypothetical protein
MKTGQGSEYLPIHFWYPGMNKIKAGKGYRDGRPLGVLSGPCPECTGTIISIKINTSRKGMECTSEKVCDTCGLVQDGAVIGKHEQQYHTPHFGSHEEWLERSQATGELDDCDNNLEYQAQQTGQRPNTDDIDYPDENNIFTNINDRNPRLEQAIKRLNKTNQSKKQPMQQWRIQQYHDTADDYINMLDINKYDALDIHYIIDHMGTLSKLPYKIDEVIYHIALLIGHKDLRKYRDHNKKLYNLLTDRLGG